MLEKVILSIGKDEFADVLFDALHREMRARQVVLFHFRDDLTVELQRALRIPGGLVDVGCGLGRAHIGGARGPAQRLFKSKQLLRGLYRLR